MLPSLQPSRPKLQQQSTNSTYTYQQRRAGHEASQGQQAPNIQAPHSNRKPQSQIEAMPPSGSIPARASFFPPPAIYDSAKCHPVFFTTNLRKPPFAIPQIATQGWNPVASGYIMEQRKPVGADVGPKTKL
ncbi:hypothetical protein P153DRAFT_366941 [Dothidotthia symphoricarpi CBS 119687]|uniref:Uncharacterized protein n=1 Tax=Dothidotthia symphoricarpi CBS 119687 TaxID=1392245 RepID=A0A6A6AGJ4_9PLEO|nr:uncharacterized protein P153DRAFT_366941 [Dothidotthia symphoricarpi CBS 119687]KAF2129551.1 hypothetical protein P153DRAFT_366941 [Dothidotthia symphoricarpi CBS 119687]